MENKYKKFKAFDKVIVREDIFPEWTCGFYSHYDKDEEKHVTTVLTKVDDKDILPYEGNEELIGTTNSPYGNNEVELEKGEIILTSSNPNMLYDCIGFLERFKEVSGNKFVTNSYDKHDYAIRFADFNPRDMEETEKHILCIKNGRIVRKNKY